jgi:hypothetical protein
VPPPSPWPPQRYNFLAGVPSSASRRLRRTIIRAVLATDLKNHAYHVTSFRWAAGQAVARPAPRSRARQIPGIFRAARRARGSLWSPAARPRKPLSGFGLHLSTCYRGHPPAIRSAPGLVALPGWSSHLYSHPLPLSGITLAASPAAAPASLWAPKLPAAGGFGASLCRPTPFPHGPPRRALLDDLARQGPGLLAGAHEALLQMALKVSDVSHHMAAWDVHRAWVARLEEEMFRQVRGRAGAGLGAGAGAGAGAEDGAPPRRFGCAGPVWLRVEAEGCIITLYSSWAPRL